MPTIRLRNVSLLGDVDVPVLGRVGPQDCIKAGEDFYCSAEVAGQAPGTWRAPTAAEQFEGLRGLSTRVTGDRTEVLCPGSGLLGTRNFEIVPAASASGTKTAPSPTPEA